MDRHAWEGGARSYDSVLVPERGTDGKVEHVLGVARDVTPHLTRPVDLNQLASVLRTLAAKEELASRGDRAARMDRPRIRA